MERLQASMECEDPSMERLKASMECEDPSMEKLLKKVLQQSGIEPLTLRAECSA